MSIPNGTYRVKDDLSLEPIHETKGFWVATGEAFTALWPDKNDWRLALRKLRRPEIVGIWTDPATQITYFDAPTHVIDRDEAIALAQRHNQIAIWDCAANTSIPTGGTGETT